MCGISGLVGKRVGCKSFDRDRAFKILEASTEAIAHRGEDGTGFYIDDQARFMMSHRRLSIVDLSAAGIQPMHTPEKKHVLSFNGEIYNYRELAKELRELGIEFHSKTDTEVLMYGLARWGIDFILRLKGMFAFAFWDEAAGTMYIVRDSLGIKPVYWTEVMVGDVESVLFSSEMKGILGSEIVPRKADLEAIQFYLRYNAIHPPHTAIEGVNALMPGHYLEISRDGIKEIEYWNVANAKTNPEQPSYEEVAKQTRIELGAAVDRHLCADTEVGAFLSGGIDSGVLVALMRERRDDVIHTFNVGFDAEGEYLDETSSAENVAKRFNASHETFKVDGITVRSCFDDFIHAIDQPSGDGLNSYLASRVTCSKVKVAFSGLGGDELFLGYRYAREVEKMQSWNRVPVLRLAIPIAKLFYDRLKIARKAAFRMAWGFLQHWPNQSSALYHAYKAIRTDASASAISPLLMRGSEAPYTMDRVGELFESEKDLLNAFSKSDLAWYDAGTLLRDSDVVSMANGLELRVPFLDHDLVDYMLTLPSSYKRHKGRHKSLLIDACADILPREVSEAPKRGFEMPVGFWLVKNFTPELRALPGTPWLSTQAVRDLVEKLYRKPREYREVWSLIVLKAWAEQFKIELPEI